MRKPSAVRAVAWGVLAAGIAAPVVRRRLRLPPLAVSLTAAGAPFAVCVLHPRSRRRDVATCALQMWAYLVTYEMPNDDPERLRSRVRIDYPVRIDRALGLGKLPSLRLQRAFARAGRIGRFEQVLVWAHWMWFFVPHSSLAYLLVRRPDLFPRGAAMMYAVYDLGLIGYWAVPTAPPWYAAQLGRLDDDEPALRRMMVEHGEAFWKGGWQPLYDLLGGNPLAAMPSLHFATSLMAARLLGDAGTLPGAVGWSYAVTLGFALVYLGEHYVIDLMAGAALTEGVRHLGPRVAGPLRAVGAGVRRLEVAARA